MRTGLQLALVLALVGSAIAFSADDGSVQVKDKGYGLGSRRAARAVIPSLVDDVTSMLEDDHKLYKDISAAIEMEEVMGEKQLMAEEEYLRRVDNRLNDREAARNATANDEALHLTAVREQLEVKKRKWDELLVLLERVETYLTSDDEKKKAKDANDDDDKEMVLDFNGVDDYANLPAMNFGAPCTVELWLNARSAEVANRVILNLGHDVDGKAVIFGLSPSMSLFVSGKNTTFSQKSLSAGKWHHLAVAMEESGATKVFVDGEIVAEGTTSTLVREERALSVSKPSANMGYFDGRIAELRLWNDYKLAEEVEDEKMMRLTGDEKDLVAYYPMNDGHGMTVVDKAHGHNVALGKDNKYTAPSWAVASFPALTAPLPPTKPAPESNPGHHL
eukprot:GFYU01004469.1.p2 GENE.GFYU01004469.1~~GFYU01004469.1.p2  ORF type:complete len:390 (+),score=143.38 GFYU01004469.1:169-1338(+)